MRVGWNDFFSLVTLGNLNYWKEPLSLQENGKLEQYKLAPEGIKQAELAGELFLKVGIPIEFSIFGFPK